MKILMPTQTLHNVYCDFKFSENCSLNKCPGKEMLHKANILDLDGKVKIYICVLQKNAFKKKYTHCTVLLRDKM